MKCPNDRIGNIPHDASCGFSKWHFCKNNRNNHAVSSQCPEINSVEYTQEDEQNERIRRSATDLNKRDGLNTGLSVAYVGTQKSWNPPFKSVSSLLQTYTKKKKCFIPYLPPKLWIHVI